jgi:hypothetical protein
MDELSQFTGEQNGTSGTENPDVVKPKKGKGKRAVAADGEVKEKKQKAKKEPKPKKDNVAYVNGLTSIEATRKFLRIAIAKKAKSEGKAEAIARYETEIEAAKAKLATLLESAGDDLDKLIELREEPNKIITHFIKVKETEFNNWLTENNLKVGRTTLKNIGNDIPASFLVALPLDLHETIMKRHQKSDFRLQAICRAFNFVDMVMAGTLVNNGGKWMTQDEIAKAEEAKKAAVEKTVAEPEAQA